MKNKLPALTPLTASWVDHLVQKKEVLTGLIEKYGSPINIHHLKMFDENIDLFKKVGKKNGINSKIFYARKANKSKFLVERTKDKNIGVDTASYNELKQCIELGIDANDLVLTAAIKNEKLITYAIENRVLIILDNDDECMITQTIAKKLGKKAIVGFRISGFNVEDKKLYSRFGFDIEKVSKSILLTRPGRTLENLDYTGLHFHLDGYSIKERAAAIFKALEIAKELFYHYLKTRFIDIGGGILINYLASKEEWETFQDQLKKAVLTNTDPITFKNNGLGFSKVDDKIVGRLKTYPFYNEINKGKFLDQLLNSTNAASDSVADLLQIQNIQLRLEPGRSLLDQVGITVARVAFRKKDSNDNTLVGLEMNMSQMSSSSEDFLLDPKVIFLNYDENESPSEVYFVGAYCLERDVLLQRRISVKRIPEIGDLVVFINTAGYMMHFFETEAHLFDLSCNLAFTSDPDALKLSDFRSDE